MNEILTKANLFEFIKFFIFYFVEISLLFFVVSFLVFIISFKFGNKLKKHLANNKFSSYIKAFIMGALTPFCSCSTIPLLGGFLKSGAGLGVSSVFLLSSPLVNPVIIALLFISFGFKFSAIYFCVIFVSATIFGSVLSKTNEEMFLKNEFLKPKFRICRTDTSQIFKPISQSTVCACKDGEISSNIYKNAFKNAVLEYKKLFIYVVFAMFIGAAIHGFVPENLIASYLGGDDLASLLVAALLGILLYVRVEALIPIGVALLSSGASSVVFGVFIITAAGISLPEIILLNRFFKLKFITLFIGFIICVAMALGVFLKLNF